MAAPRAESETPDHSINSTDHRALYQAYFERCNAHDLKGMRSFYTSPLKVNDEDRSPNEVTAQFEPLIVGFPDWQWEARNLTIEGDYLALHFSITGTHRGEFQGISPPDGRLRRPSSHSTMLLMASSLGSGNLLDIPSLIKQIT